MAMVASLGENIEEFAANDLKNDMFSFQRFVSFGERVHFEEEKDRESERENLCVDKLN